MLVTAAAVCVYVPLAVPTWATGVPTSLVVHCTTTCLHVPAQPTPQSSCMVLPAMMAWVLTMPTTTGVPYRHTTWKTRGLSHPVLLVRGKWPHVKSLGMTAIFLPALETLPQMDKQHLGPLQGHKQVSMLCAC